MLRAARRTETMPAPLRRRLARGIAALGEAHNHKRNHRTLAPSRIAARALAAASFGRVPGIGLAAGWVAPRTAERQRRTLDGQAA